MALFKILRGQSNKIGDVAFNDGYAYFTPDTGAFYIDAIVDGSDHRIQINSKETLGIFTSSTEPLDAITNDLWIDISDDGLGPLLKYKNNNGKWDTIGSVDVMSKTNPTGVGSIAMNPKDEAEVGKNSAIFGNMMSAIGENCFAAGGPLFGSVTSLSVNGVKNFKGIYMGAISATSDTFECMNDERLNEDFTVSCDTYLRDGTVICVRYLDDDGHIAYTGSRKIIFKEVDYDNEHTNVTKYTIDEPFGVDIPSGSEVYIVLSTAEVDGVASAIIGSGGTVCGSSSVGVGVNPVVDGNGSIAGGYNSTASGDNSVAVGYNSYVANDDAHAEGSATIANGWGAHSEGIPLGIDTKYLTSNVVCSGETYLVYYTNNRVNPGNIAFFNDNLRVGDFVLIRYIAPDEKGEDGNYYTTTRRIVSITEHTITLDLPIKTLNSSHIKIDAGAFILKAQNTQANSRGAHAEGQGTNANNTATHAEGSNTKASGYAAHAEGQETVADATGAHAEGYRSHASGSNSHAEGYETEAFGVRSHAEGSYSKATGSYSHAEGGHEYKEVCVVNIDPDMEMSGYYHTGQSILGIMTTGDKYVRTPAIGDTIRVVFEYQGETYETSPLVVGDYSDGTPTPSVETVLLLNGVLSHSVPNVSGRINLQGASVQVLTNTCASGNGSHAEGIGSKASGKASHAEGCGTTAAAAYSHAEGGDTNASGTYSHAEGYNTRAKGRFSHAEGYNTEAAFDYQHVQGKNTNTTVKGYENFVHVVGWGKSDSPKNIHTIDIDGNAVFEGSVTANGIKLNSSRVFYGVCDTASTNLTKYVKPQGDSATQWDIVKTGDILFCRMYNELGNYDVVNKEISLCIQLNGSYQNAIPLKSSTHGISDEHKNYLMKPYSWNAGSVITCVYNGTCWLIVSMDTATLSHYGLTKLCDEVCDDSTVAATPYAMYKFYQDTIIPAIDDLNTIAVNALKEAESAKDAADEVAGKVGNITIVTDESALSSAINDMNDGDIVYFAEEYTG